MQASPLNSLNLFCCVLFCFVLFFLFCLFVCLLVIIFQFSYLFATCFLLCYVFLISAGESKMALGRSKFSALGSHPEAFLDHQKQVKVLKYISELSVVFRTPFKVIMERSLGPFGGHPFHYSFYTLL